MAKTAQQWKRPDRRPSPHPVVPTPEMLDALFGRAPAAPVKPPLMPALPWEAIRHRIRQALRPWYLIGAVGVTGLIAHAGDAPPAYVVPVGVLAAGATWVVARRKTRGKPETSARRARAALYTALAAAGWVTAAAGAGDLRSLSGALVASALVPTGALAAAPYWRYVRNQPITIDVPAPVDNAEDAVLHTWRTKLAQRRGDTVAHDEIGERITAETDGKAPGTYLTNWRRIAGGWAATIVAVEGSGFDFKAVAFRRAIAQAYRVGEGAINITVNADDALTAELMVQPRNVLSQPQEWSGPASIDMRAGTAPVGRWMDDRPLNSRLYVTGWGAPSKLVLGTTGSGKTEMVRLDLLIERYAAVRDADGKMHGLFVSILHDSKHGADYSELLGGLHGFGHTREEAHLIVDALIREMERRYEFLKSLRWTDHKGREHKGGLAWDPFVHGPIISAVWDEFHMLAADKLLVPKLEILARQQRACGMRATMATHMATIGDTGSQAIRDMLAGGTTVLMRTTSALNKSLTSGTRMGDVDPRTLPQLPGTCYIIDGDADPMMARYSYVSGEELYDLLHDDNNKPIGYPAEIPPETLEAFGPEWDDWQRCRAAGAQWKPKPADVTTTAGKPVKEGAEAAVLAAVTAAGGPIKFNDIVTKSGFSTSTCTAVLKTLVESGLVTQTGRGTYQAAGAN